GGGGGGGGGEGRGGEGVGVRQDALAVQGGEQRDLEPFDQAFHLIASPAADGAEPGERDEGIAVHDGVGQNGRDLLDARWIRQDLRHVELDVAVVLDLRPALGEVLRHVDVHRAWAPFEPQG